MALVVLAAAVVAGIIEFPRAWAPMQPRPIAVLTATRVAMHSCPATTCPVRDTSIAGFVYDFVGRVKGDRVGDSDAWLELDTHAGTVYIHSSMAYTDMSQSRRWWWDR